MADLTPGAVVDVAPLVRRVVAPNPGIMTGPGTNTYLVGERDVAAIDPGPNDEGHLDAVAAAADGRVRWILVTHTHEDHSPGAAGLKARTGADVLGFGPRDSFVPDHRLDDGDEITGDGFTLTAIHTPGHASNHLCYLLADDAVLFSGDHIMQGSTVVIAPPDGDMRVYIHSLERLFDYEIRAIAPGHGDLITDPAAKITDYLTHRQAREDAIVDVLDRGPNTVDGIVKEVYVDVAGALHPIARHSVLAHLLKLRADDRAQGDDMDSKWRLLPTRLSGGERDG